MRIMAVLMFLFVFVFISEASGSGIESRIKPLKRY
jgi:hypothetical protein